MSLRPVSMIERSTRRPIRPNPLMATRTAINSILLLHSRERSLGCLLRCNPERLIEFLVGRARSEMVNTDENAVRANIALPAERRGRFDGNVNASGTKHLRPIGGVLLVEQAPARHRHHLRRNRLLRQDFVRRERDFNLRATGEKRHLWLSLASA